MSKRPHATESDRDPVRYAIFDDGGRYRVLRKLPTDEFLTYYQKRRDEILVDGNQDYWLMLNRFHSREAAECWCAQYGIGAALVSIFAETSGTRPDARRARVFHPLIERGAQP